MFGATRDTRRPHSVDALRGSGGRIGHWRALEQDNGTKAMGVVGFDSWRRAIFEVATRGVDSWLRSNSAGGRSENKHYEIGLRKSERKDAGRHRHDRRQTGLR